jgi:hypothetical protein
METTIYELTSESNTYACILSAKSNNYSQRNAIVLFYLYIFPFTKTHMYIKLVLLQHQETAIPVGVFFSPYFAVFTRTIPLSFQ